MTDLDEIPAMFAMLEGQTADINPQDYVVTSPRDQENLREWRRIERKVTPRKVRSREAESKRRQRAANPLSHQQEWQREKARYERNPELAERRKEYKRQWAAKKRMGV